MADAIVLMSGGIDSAACAAFMQSSGFQATGLFIDHGQRAAKLERNAAASMARHLGISFRTASLSSDVSFPAGELIGRNAFLISTALLLSDAPSIIAMGVHGGTSYYDCSTPFISAMAATVAEYSNGRTVLLAPFVTWSKRDVFNYFASASLPITKTYSCENGTAPACGKCLSCRDREALGC